MSPPDLVVAVELTVDGEPVVVERDDVSLLEALRDELGRRGPKDGCSPQGQCGCCTVLVDGQPRVACVTPVRRVRGRAVTTIDGLHAEVAGAWADAFCATGASQCGFCTPGIVVRLEGLRAKLSGSGGAPVAPGAAGSSGAAGAAGPSDAPAGVSGSTVAPGVTGSAGAPDGLRGAGAGGAAGAGMGSEGSSEEAVHRALAAHLCRCTGWQTILEAWRTAVPALARGTAVEAWPGGRNASAAARRASLEGGVAQRVRPEVALGRGGFAEDLAPSDALVAVPDGGGGWVVGESLSAARRQAGKVQGRRTTVAPEPPLALPDVDGAVVALRTCWVEPAYLETDASWCTPGGEPATPLANGGAFGAKASSPVAAVARRLADEHGRAVRVLYAREDVVRLGPKRPPVALAVRPDGTGVLRVAATPGVDELVAAVAPGLAVEQVELDGPPTSLELRGAGWLEAVVAVAAATEGSGASAASATAPVRAPSGGWARAELAEDGGVDVEVGCGAVLDEVVARSYVIGAVHQALGWVTSEALALDVDGEVLDLTIRSFGILRAADMPEVRVRFAEEDGREPVTGSDAVLAAAALAVWRRQGLPPLWPTGVPVRPA